MHLTFADAEALFSTERMRKYYINAGSDPTKTLVLYTCNAELSQALYIPLCVLEIAIRNALNPRLEACYGRADWYEAWIPHRTNNMHIFYDLGKKSHAAKSDTTNSLLAGQVLTVDRVVAKFMFGFWTSLFNSRYDIHHWGYLKHAFPNLPRRIRQPRTIDNALTEIRKLRNKVYHYEPICWDLVNLQATHQKINKLIKWIDPKLQIWLSQIDTFPGTLAQVKYKLDSL